MTAPAGFWAVRSDKGSTQTSMNSLADEGMVPGFCFYSTNISIFMQYFQEITEASSEGEFVFLKRGESKYIFLHLCARMSNPSPPMNHFPLRHHKLYNRTVSMRGNGCPSKSHYETHNSWGTKNKFCLDCSSSVLDFFSLFTYFQSTLT